MNEDDLDLLLAVVHYEPNCGWVRWACLLEEVTLYVKRMPLIFNPQ